jgi:aryl-alcohol dehydrogenase-like predicted oxidoreductase
VISSTTLGSSGLSVSRLGIGSSYGVGGRDVCWAVEQGVNYLYWGTWRRADFGRAIREAAAAHGRERVVLVVQSYARLPSLVGPSLRWALGRLGFEYADVLLLGWWNSAPPEAFLEAAARLRERGLFRHLMVSGHDRPALARMAKSGEFSAIMTRYNAAHRGAEREIFEELPATRPGVVAYTATRWRTLLRPAPGMSASQVVPTAGDCYRFCLSHPAVDVVLCGAANGQELRDAVAAVERGPLDPEALAAIKGYGDLVHHTAGHPLWAERNG